MREALADRLLLPVVHMVCDLDAAKSELPRIFNGDTSFEPAAGVGSNTDRPEPARRVPRAVICGGGIPKEEYEELKELLGKVTGKEIPWYKVYPGDVDKYIPEEERKVERKGPPDGKYIAVFFKDVMKDLQ